MQFARKPIFQFERSVLFDLVSKLLKTLKVCQKQGKKINKYKYRTDRVLKDILWHIIGVKRCNEFNWSGE